MPEPVYYSFDLRLFALARPGARMANWKCGWATSPIAEGSTGIPHRASAAARVSGCARFPRTDGTADAVRREVYFVRKLYTAIRRYFTELNQAQDVARGLASYRGEGVGR